jgi:pyruvate dehydrogenase E2 component (dihydrolipoamide acetyltransferase)
VELMAVENVLVPDIGDDIEVEVVEVLVEVGVELAVDDPLITLESDKASMDVPSPFAGTVVELAVAVGDKVAEGGLIVTMEVSEEEVAAAASGSAQDKREEEAPAETSAPAVDAPVASVAPTPPPASPRSVPASLPSIDEASFARA